MEQEKRVDTITSPQPSARDGCVINHRVTFQISQICPPPTETSLDPRLGQRASGHRRVHLAGCWSCFTRTQRTRQAKCAVSKYGTLAFGRISFISKSCCFTLHSGAGPGRASLYMLQDKTGVSRLCTSQHRGTSEGGVTLVAYLQKGRVA